MFSQPARPATTGLSTRDFDRIYRAPARRQLSQRFLVVARPRTSGAGPTRWGVSVKARLGTAVLRNRVKRRLREILRHAQAQLPAGWDVVVQPRTSNVATTDFSALSRELEALLAAALGRNEKA
ncbi:MAG TPA: ribonuclease P protein component [Candidatus Acidoferrales bacterium]|nr:ribonuclease P protein component [Candidatus Acidoferrales bacterium]